jgi:hypothetical protein
MKWSGKQLRDAVAQLVADRRPGAADLEVADVVGHEAGARLKMVRSLPRSFIRRSWLVSMDSRSSSSLIFRSATLGIAGRVLDAGDLAVAPGFQRLGRGGVVAVDVDDHGLPPSLARLLTVPLTRAFRQQHARRARCRSAKASR